MTDDIFDGLSSEDQDALEKLGAELPEFVMKEVRKQVGPLLQESVAQMRKFQERMDESNEKEKQSLLCSQVNCIHAARWSYIWPGQRERLLACDDCMKKARGLAQSMNFELGDVKQLSHEIPIEVKMDFDGVMRSRFGLIKHSCQAFNDAVLIVISITHAEIMALVVNEDGPRCYPISNLWLRFNYRGESCIVSCEGNAGDTKWRGSGGEDYIDLLEPNSLRFVMEPDELIKLVVETVL